MKTTRMPYGAWYADILNGVGDMLGFPTSKSDYKTSVVYKWEREKGALLNVTLIYDIKRGLTEGLRLYLMDDSGTNITYSEVIVVEEK